MKILIVHNYYRQRGGEDAVFASETQLLRSHGHEVIEYVEDNREINKINGVSAAIQSIWSFRSYGKIIKLLQNAKPDLAHFHNTFLLISPSAYCACKKMGIPVVQTLHNYRLYCPGGIFYRDGHICEDCVGKVTPWPGVIHGCWRTPLKTAVVCAMIVFHRWLRTWQDKVCVYIAPSEFCRQKFIKCGFLEDKIVLKPNFVYPDPGMKNDNGNYVVFVGRLTSEKGAGTLLKAWQSLKNIPIKIVGTGPLLQEFQEAINHKNVLNAELLGEKSHGETLALIKKARFLVFPSEWYETFGMVIVEAFACGVPVIVSRLGAMEEVVEDMRTGLYFDPGNAKDLAAKVQWAWEHPEEMQEMGRQARKEYESKYAAERNYELLMEIYKMAIQRGR